MATIGRDPGGRRRILFVARDGKRKTIRLGRCSEKQALAFKVKLEALAAGQFSGIDDETARWIARLPDDMHRKLAAVGLVEPRERQAATAGLTIGALCEQFIGARDDVKKSTRTVYELTRRNLVDFFGPDRLIRDITPYDAEEWRRYLSRKGLSEATARKRAGVCKQILRSAIKRRILTENPFQEIKSTSVANDDRHYFLTQADAEKILAACPDSQWRAIFALARYGGLRTPSETLALTWADVNWEKNRVLIRSVKTERHEGHATRMIPLFPELRPHLLAAFEEAEPGTEYVITRYRQTNANLRTQLTRIIERAGLTTWPKLFQNCRSTRETELGEQWPEHIVCAWLGNSRAVARKHYFQIRDEDYERAAQNPAQYPAVQGGKAKEAGTCDRVANPVFQSDTNAYKSLRDKDLRLKGSEQTALALSKTPISAERGTESGTPESDSGDDADLQLIVRRWPGLPVEVRASIVKIIQAHTPPPQDRREAP